MSNEIRTVGDLRELVDMLSKYPDRTKINFVNRFEDFSVSMNFTYNIGDDAIELEVEKIGSVLEGHHRVLGGE